MCVMVRCYMWRHAVSDEVLWNVVMRCGMVVWYMWNMVVCYDARCEMWLWNTEWCGILDMVVWCSMIEMQYRMCGVVWNVCCGIVWCGKIYLNVVMGMAWWGGMWAWLMWIMVRLMWNVVRCGMLQFQTWCEWNYNYVEYGGAECGVLVGVMFHNATCGQWRCDVKLWWCGIVMKNVAYAMCWLLCDVRCGKWCNAFRCGGMM